MIVFCALRVRARSDIPTDRGMHQQEAVAAAVVASLRGRQVTDREVDTGCVGDTWASGLLSSSPV